MIKQPERWKTNVHLVSPLRSFIKIPNCFLKKKKRTVVKTSTNSDFLFISAHLMCYYINDLKRSVDSTKKNKLATSTLTHISMMKYFKQEKTQTQSQCDVDYLN